MILEFLADVSTWHPFKILALAAAGSLAGLLVGSLAARLCCRRTCE